MTVQEAINIKNDFFGSNTHTDDEEFMFTEAMDYLISETGDPKYIMDLGGYYYEIKKFDLALKYYEMAAEYDNVFAYVCLGYIWYYGRTGEKDYKKAFEYYSKAADRGNITAAYKKADMYRNGYYVEKDFDKFAEIIEELYPKVKNAKYTNEPLPEIFIRLAMVRTRQNSITEAKNLYNRARDFLEQRIKYNNFFGNLSIMKMLIDDIYSLKEFDKNNFSLYDLFYILKEENTVRFMYDGEEHTVQALIDNGELIVRFDDKYYRTTYDFFSRAEIDGILLTEIYDSLYGFEVM